MKHAAYGVKYRRKGATHRVMTPLEAMARLAALIPPPRYPLVRYAGVLAPNSPWRKSLVPRAPEPEATCARATGASRPVVTTKASESTGNAAFARADRAARNAEGDSSFQSTPAATATRTAPTHIATSSLAPADIALPSSQRGFVLSDAHLRRLLDGALLATSPRIDWARLLRRSLDLDALACPRCGKTLRVLAAITDRVAARRILEHIGLSARAPPLHAARDPSELQDDDPRDLDELPPCI